MDPPDLLPLLPEYSIDAATAAVSARRDTVEVPVFWIVLLLSALVHVAVLFVLPPLRLTPHLSAETRLDVALEPRRPALEAPTSIPAPAFVTPIAPSAPPPRPAITAPRVAPPPRPESIRPPGPPKRRAPPPVVTAPPAPEETSPIVPPAPAVPEQAEPPRARDLASYIEARRRARGESAVPPSPASVQPAQSDEEARRNQIVARNLGLGRAPEFGGSRKPGGGIFQVTRLHYSEAEFIFYGWNKDIRRNTSQLIEVRKGNHSDIKLAVIRRMIAIIREHESGDFLWESDRLGRDVTLSARPADNAGLEEFLMREFFGEPGRQIGALGGDTR